MTRLLIGAVILIITSCSFILEEEDYYFMLVPIAFLLTLSALFGICPITSFVEKNRNNESLNGSAE